jgi:hypothetical protein
VLYDSQLLEIAGDARLCCGNASLFQQTQKLLLRGDPTRLNQR